MFSNVFFRSLSLSLSLFLALAKLKSDSGLQKRLILSNKISHQTQGMKGKLSHPPISPSLFFFLSLSLSLSLGIASNEMSRERSGMRYDRFPFSANLQSLLNRVKKIYRYISYIQVGMKNKKYFLAIFRFITIFFSLGTRGRRDGVKWGEEGG